jgi:hypothetical protein
VQVKCNTSTSAESESAAEACSAVREQDMFDATLSLPVNITAMAVGGGHINIGAPEPVIETYEALHGPRSSVCLPTACGPTSNLQGSKATRTGHRSGPVTVISRTCRVPAARYCSMFDRAHSHDQKLVRHHQIADMEEVSRSPVPLVHLLAVAGNGLCGRRYQDLQTHRSFDLR